MNIKLLSLTVALFLTLSASARKAKIFDKVGACTAVENADVLKAGGGHHVEVGISSFLMPENSDAEFAENLRKAKECSLPIESANGFFPGDIKLTGPYADLPRAIRYTEVAMRRAAEVGIKTAVLGSGGARSIPQNWPRETGTEQFIDLLRAIGPIAQKYGITIVIEPLRRQECNFINTVQEGYEIAKRVNHPNIRVLADVYHMTQEKEGPQSILNAGRKYLRHVHLAENESRTAPGTKGDDFTPYFRALKKIKYKGTISLECGWDDFNTQVKGSINEVKRQLHAAYGK